jgi:hypothetical protein
MENTPSYGQTRKRREEVTYAQIERATTNILGNRRGYKMVL